MNDKDDKVIFIPLSKTIIKDCTLLELQSGEHKLEQFLAKQHNLSSDLSACYNVLKFRKLGLVCVNDFRSLYIGLQVLEKTKGIKFKTTQGKQLSQRELDLQSSQWESAKVCCGQESSDKRYHVEIARNVVQRYNNGERESLFNTKDEVYEKLFDFVLKDKSWSISNPEIDIFFAIFHPERLDDITNNNPTWKHHESDRTESIKEALKQFMTGQMVMSDDHRIVIGIALLAYLLGENVIFKNYGCVWKSFPLFFDMLDNLQREVLA